MEDFDYIMALKSINQLIGNIQLKRNEHEHLLNACEMIRQRLEQCDNLEDVAQLPE